MRTPWHPARVERLREAYRKGGKEGAMAAFPAMPRAAIKSAILRYVVVQPDGEPAPCDRGAIRAAIGRLDHATVCERVADLLGSVAI